jgi:dTDP-4-dehydrorhamnose reductase
VVLTGAEGQLGTELRRTAPAGWRVRGFRSAGLDVSQREMVLATFQHERPALVIHAAAYTAVDAAEHEPDRAEAINVQGAANVASAACVVGARLIHISTDFVFDGCGGVPYAPSDPPNPLNVYGRTKLESEHQVTDLSSGQALILRTAWLYSSHGRNFVLTMLRLMKERESLGVVSDQVGTPTWARGLASAIWAAAESAELRGTHHWTDAGVASWYDFALAIQEEALTLGLLHRSVPIHPVRTVDFPTSARRPSYSVLDKTLTWAALGAIPPHWRVNLRAMLRELAGG